MAGEFLFIQLRSEFLNTLKSQNNEECPDEAPRFQEKKKICRSNRNGEKATVGGNPNKYYEERNNVGC